MKPFSPSSVEEAFLSLSSPCLDEQNKAGAFLFAWSNSPNFLYTSFLIVQHSANAYVRHASSLALCTAIINKWNSTPNDLQNSIRTYFLEQILPRNTVLKEADLPIELLAIFNRIIVVIALYEYPQKWPNFFTDFLSVPDSSPQFSRSFLVIAQYLEEIDRCEFLTQERIMQLEALILSFKEQLISKIFYLISRSDEAAIVGIGMLQNLLQWGEVPEILTEPIFLTLVNKNLFELNTSNKTVECLSVALFDRCDVASIFDKISVPIIRAFASMQQHTPLSVGFITKFLKKYIYLIEALCFPDKDLETRADCLRQLMSIIFNNRTAPPTTIHFFPSETHYCIDEVRRLFECILMQPPGNSYFDDFWQLWRDVARKMYAATRGSSQRLGGNIVELVRPLIPLIFTKTTEYLPSCIESGTITNTDASIYFEHLVRSFPTEAVQFIMTSVISPQIVYFAGFLKVIEDRQKQFINEFSKSFQELPIEFYEAMLFFYSRLCYVLLPDHLKEFIRLCSVCLFSPVHSLQLSAAHALYATFNIVPQRLEPSDILSSVPNLALVLSDKATVSILKLASYMTNVLNLDYTMLVNTVLSILGQRTDVALRGIEEMALSAAEKCNLFFTPLWAPLFELIEANVGFDDLIFRAIAAATVNSRLPEIQEQIIILISIVSNSPIPREVLFEYFAVVRTNRPEFDTFYQQIEDLVKSSEPSPQMFRMLSSFSPTVFDIEMVVSKIVEGSQNISPDISKEALHCARNLFTSFVSSDRLIACVGLYRRTFIRIAISCLMDGVHQNGFSKQSMLLNDIFEMSESLGDNLAYMAEFVEEWAAVVAEATPGLYAQVANRLNRLKGSKSDFKEALRDLLIVMRKATPYQMRTYFEEDTQIELNGKEDMIMINDEDEDIPIGGIQELTLST